MLTTGTSARSRSGLGGGTKLIAFSTPTTVSVGPADERTIKRWPRVKLTIRQRTRVLDQWPPR